MAYLLTVVNVAILGSIKSGSMLALGALYSFVLFREKPTVPKCGGIAMAVIASVLLSI